MGMLLQKWFQPIDRVEPNLKYFAHFCKFSFEVSRDIEICCCCMCSWFVTFIYLFELLVLFIFTNLNFLPHQKGFKDISDKNG